MVLAALLWPAWPALRLSHDEGRIGYLPLDGTGEFTLAYVHSIDRLPIEENLRVREGGLVVDSTRLRQFGAGMGHIPGEGTGRADGEWWVLEGMDRDIGPDLVVRVGAEAVDHRIRYPAGEIRLSPCWAAQRVIVEPVRISTARLLAGRPPQGGCA